MLTEFDTNDLDIYVLPTLEKAANFAANLQRETGRTAVCFEGHFVCAPKIKMYIAGVDRHRPTPKTIYFNSKGERL